MGAHRRPPSARVGEWPSGRDLCLGPRATLGAIALALALAGSLAGCRAPVRNAPAAVTGDEIALYRDRAVVIQRVELRAERAGAVRLTLRLPAGLEASDAVILDRGGLAEVALRAAEPTAPHDAQAAAAVALDATAPRPGRFALALGYATDHLAWDAAYTMTTTAARDRAVVRGAIAIRNTTGLALHARTRVIDAELGAWRDLTAEQLRAAIRGPPGPLPAPSPSPSPSPRDAESRDLGTLALGNGETRVELLAAAPPRTLRSVLVYDPIGAALDHTGAIPVSDPSIGVASAAATQVTESFEIDRDPATTRGLPGGPVRLIERHPDGSLELLGESRLFGAATRVADVDTIAIGTARGVVGHRVRRDFAKDDDQRRFSEEFLVTIDNARPRPVELVLREHLYRGQNWTLAYQSVAAVKEGPQQIALRTQVPANGRAKVLYVVVYTW